MSLIKQHLYNTMIATSALHRAETLSDLHYRVSEMLANDSVTEIERFIDELEDYGIESEEQIDDAYYGCYPSVENFCEDLIDGIGYLDNAPSLIQDCIDYEKMWHHYLQYDYFTVYDRNSGDYYFFNRNF